MVNVERPQPPNRVLSKLTWLYALARARPSKKKRMVNDGRRILEAVIFQAVAREPSMRRIMSVGCHRYSAWYPKLFDLFADKTFETVDPDPAAGEFGSSRHHRESGFTELASEAKLRDRYDLIIISGVFGYGINSEEQKAAALGAAVTLLKRGGLLLLGYRDSPTVVDFDRSLVASDQFSAESVPGFDEAFVRSKNTNGVVYLCLRRI